MKIDRIVYGVALACMSIAPAMSQVDKEVEVTQAFIPQVIPATKPAILPDLSDESYINPDIDYSITPISIHTEIDTTPYKPVEMDYWEYKRQKNYYAKLGIALPFSSVADIYATRSNSSGYMIGYLNYEGKYADLMNDYGVERDASQSHLTTGAGAGFYLGSRVLEGRFKYENDKWSRYATSVEDDEHPLYQSVGVDLRFGDNFSDLDRWNYSIFGGVEQMWSRSDYANTTFDSRVDVGHSVGAGDLILSAMYDYIGGTDNYSNSSFGVAAGYSFEADRAKISLGMEYNNEGVKYSGYAANVALPIDTNSSKSGRKNLFMPHFQFDYQISSTLAIGYLEVDSYLLRNDFASLSSRNPYLAPGLFASQSSLVYDLGVGLKGTIADQCFGYNISGRYIRENDRLYWALAESAVSYTTSNNDFVGSLSDQDRINIVLESEYRPNSKFTLDFDAVWAKIMDDKDQVYSNGMSDFELKLGGEYRVESFGFGLDCEMLSSRDFSVVYESLTGRSTLSNVTIPTTFNLNANVDYTLENDLIIFADVTNILNDKLYEWVGYRGYGIGVMVGVKFEF